MEETPDFSKAVEKIQEMLESEDGQSRIQNLLGLFASGNGVETDKSDENSSSKADGMFGAAGGLDLSGIMQMGGIISALNGGQQNTHTNFLNALKPFLGQNRRKKLDQAAQIMKMTAIFKVLKENSQGGV